MELKKYPLFIYNEPATYNDFKAGINTDPSNENLLPNELRNGLNLHYVTDTLRKRNGAVKVLEMEFLNSINNVQGIFLLTVDKTYIVVAADGQLFYSIYAPNINIDLKQLPISINFTDKTISQQHDLPQYNFDLQDIDHEGYIYKYNETESFLRFQNTLEIEALSYNDRLYITTGTRFVVVYLGTNNILKAEVVYPYEPNGIEYVNIGPNLLSAFPEYHVKLQELNGVKTQIHFVRAVAVGINEVEYEAVMTFEQGKSAKDYLFKWEYITADNSIYPVTIDSKKYIYNSVILDDGRFTRGLTKITLSLQDIDNIIVRCSFAEEFKEILQEDGTLVRSTQIYNEGRGDFEYEDFVPNQLIGWFGAANSGQVLRVNKETADLWKTIQSCRKITSDGNKFLLYGDKYNSGQWFKTVINNPFYITNRGGLSFKTNKNEELVKVIQFKGIIVAFSSSQYLGGNISVVLGNGDDYDDGSNYSPYFRKIVNTVISTDNYKTVQVVENMIIFKYKDTLHMIEGSDLNSEIIEVHSINDKVKQQNQDVQIPWEDNNCITELTPDYYALVWDEIKTVINNEIVTTRPAIRAKMYYKRGYMQGNKVYFPWLVDQSEYFNTRYLMYIDGLSTYLYNNILIQYQSNEYTDLEQPFETIIRMRAYDLNYPKFSKFINKALVYYYRGPKQPLDFELNLYNEAGYLLLSKHVSDKRVLHEGQIATDTILGSSIVESKTFNLPYKFPLLLCDAEIKINNTSDFSLSSITYNYTVTTTPELTRPEVYKNIIRIGNPILLTKESLLAAAARNQAEKITIVSGGGAQTEVNTETSQVTVLTGGGAGD
jgi:hypothetical protein